MNYAQALAAANRNERVTHPDMQPGSFMRFDPHYNNLRREFPSGSSCTFIPYDSELARADWASLDRGWR